MTEKNNDSHQHDLFITEFPKGDYNIIDYLQGRVHFAILDQIKLMRQSGMTQTEIRKKIISNVTEIVDNSQH